MLICSSRIRPLLCVAVIIRVRNMNTIAGVTIGNVIVNVGSAVALLIIFLGLRITHNALASTSTTSSSKLVIGIVAVVVAGVLAFSVVIRIGIIIIT